MNKQRLSSRKVTLPTLMMLFVIITIMELTQFTENNALLTSALLLDNDHNNAEGANAEEQVRLLLSAGDRLIGQGRPYYSDALAKYTEALMRDPRSVRALYSRAELYSLLKRHEDAVHDLDQLLQTAPSHVEGLRLRMSLNAQRGHLHDALRDAEKLAHVHDTNKQTNKAKEVRSTAEKLRQYALRWSTLRDILDVPVSSLLMTCSKDTKDHNNINDFNDDDKVKKRKLELQRQRRFEESVRVLTLVISDFARNDLELRIKRAACALLSHNTKVASNDVRFVLERESQNLMAMVINAMALRHLGATKQAKDALHHCLNIDPENKLCASVFRLLRVQERHFAEIQAQIQNKNYEKALKAIAESTAVEAHPPFEEQLME